jgi:endonuclease/exonuclease/phosphatase family metal-dependent hydrolase
LQWVDADGVDHVLHVLAAHPTPPSFEGPERRNSRRNHDEIRLLADYLDPVRGRYLRDDNGRRGALGSAASFVILGDLNADPLDGNSHPGAIAQLLDHPRVHREVARGSLVPRSDGGVIAAQLQGGANATHQGDPAQDTADFSDGANAPGNLRVDYVLPSGDLQVCASGVYWPRPTDHARRVVPEQSSDHRLVWVDIALPGHQCPR